MAQISIILPATHGATHLEASLASVLGQTFDDIEVLIATSPATEALVRSLVATRDPRVRLLPGGQPRELASPRNRGIAAAIAPYVAFLDVGDSWNVDKLRAQKILLDRHSWIDAVGSWVWCLTPAGAVPLALPPDPDITVARLITRNRALPTSSVMVRRECLRHERFDPRLGDAADWELWVRLLLKQRKFDVVPEYLTFQRLPSPVLNRPVKMSQLWRLSQKLARLGLAQDLVVSPGIQAARLAERRGDAVMGRRIRQIAQLFSDEDCLADNAAQVRYQLNLRHPGRP